MPKATKAGQSGIDAALDTDAKMMAAKERQEAQEDTVIKKGRGRPKKKNSKRQGVVDGTHVNLNIIIPVELHEKLGVEAFTNKQKDMSDIITDLLTKYYKTK